MKDNNLQTNLTIKLNQKLYDFSEPMIMGIINVTPDSFYEGSRVQNEKIFLEKLAKWQQQGVNIIDLGAISTRPNANLQDSNEELNRLIPFLKLALMHFPEMAISIDTFRSDVAKEALDMGAHLINDVYANRFDGQMMDVIAEYNVPYVLMHSRGDASDMNEMTDYKNIVSDVIKELQISLTQLREKGVKDVIIDPGFGFAKTIEQNYTLLNNLSDLNILECPILVGVSRKSMLYKPLKKQPNEVLHATTALNLLALSKGASILRVHDVNEAKDMVEISKLLNRD